MRVNIYSYIIFIISLLWMAAMVTCLICQFPHCERVDCEPVTNCTGEVKSSGGGYCGCCAACFTYIGHNEPCELKEGVEALLYPQTAVCDKGLYCEGNSSSTCQPFPGIEFG
ncbi:uncharacterized protein LOC128233807 [Mya arenaria]|uniref:uncharacterized protein LOC128233807 n=1 Tax=Mya arenaria TaxID=6604 RepID=UPI0022E96E61|nr:uncharacterized protein LOC128233807 [Mya arenaria]